MHSTSTRCFHPTATAGGATHAVTREKSVAPTLLDFHPAPADVRAEVLAGLARPQKVLPCKFFYDARGSGLFDDICGLPEYYPTRTETRITRDHAAEMADVIGSRARLVEYGSGSSVKTRILLDHLSDPAGYVPIDISRTHLMQSARTLAAGYPGLEIKAVCADYTRPFHLPAFADRPASVVAYFPGSTIGNFEPDDAVAFLNAVRRICGPGSGMLIGVDLKKDPAVLHAAYNDSAGVTAAFNRNVLRHIIGQLGSDFDEATFDHYAFYNVPVGRMEMHLVSRTKQTVRVGDTAFDFAAGESIHTENCYKYSVPAFQALAARAGYVAGRVWTDAEAKFSVHYLTSDDGES